MPRIFSLKRLTLYLGGTSAPSVKGDQALPFLTGTWCRSEMALLAGHHECHVTRCVLTAAAVFVHLGAFDFSADYWLRFDLQGVVSQYTALGFWWNEYAWGPRNCNGWMQRLSCIFSMQQLTEQTSSLGDRMRNLVFLLAGSAICYEEPDLVSTSLAPGSWWKFTNAVQMMKLQQDPAMSSESPILAFA